jgi:hypothetical protein
MKNLNHYSLARWRQVPWLCKGLRSEDNLKRMMNYKFSLFNLYSEKNRNYNLKGFS